MYRKRMSTFERITVDPEVMLGQAVIRGTRLPVYVIVEAVAEGNTIDELVQAYPFLGAEDVRQALLFAAHLSHGSVSI